MSSQENYGASINQKLLFPEGPVQIYSSKLTQLLLSLFALSFLLCSQLAYAEVIVAGQCIGKSKWNNRSQLKSSQYKIEENFKTPYKRGPTLRIQGPLSDGVIGEAEFFYDESNTLVAAKLFVKNPDKFLNQLSKTSLAKRQTEDSYLLRDLRLRLEIVERTKIVYVSSLAFDSKFPAVESKSERWMPPWKTIAIFGGACLLAIVFLWTLFCLRKKLWGKREILADYVVGCSCVSAVLFYFPETRLGLSKLYLMAYLIGYTLILTWALRTVRLSGWLPRKMFIEFIWVLPTTPLLIIPVVVRNFVKSAHYAGLVLLFAELAGIAYYSMQTDLLMALTLLPASAILSGGIVRLYCSTYSLVGNEKRHPTLAVLATLFAWPFVLTVGVTILVFNVLMAGLRGVLMMLPAAIVLGLMGIILGWNWLTLIAIGLLLIGTLPCIAGFLAFVILPTGYSNLEFGSPNIHPAKGVPMLGIFDSAGNAFKVDEFGLNPANGMPMFGGTDVFGNPFGSNFNDP